MVYQHWTKTVLDEYSIEGSQLILYDVPIKQNKNKLNNGNTSSKPTEKIIY